MKLRYTILMALLTLGVSGCGSSAHPISLDCVRNNARSSARVASVETEPPPGGPASGAKGYVKVGLRGGGIVAVSTWPDEGAASKAAQAYTALVGAGASTHVEQRGATVIVTTAEVTAAETKFLSRCE